MKKNSSHISNGSSLSKVLMAALMCGCLLSGLSCLSWSALDQVYAAEEEEKNHFVWDTDWYAQAMGLEEYISYTASVAKNPITVAVLGTGVSKNNVNPEFIGRVNRGYDILGEKKPFGDDEYDDDLAASGIADDILRSTQGLNVYIMSVRTERSSGDYENNQENFAKGIRLAVNQGAKVIVWPEVGSHSAQVDEAVAYAVSRGAVVVVAAGEKGEEATTRKCPAHMNSVIVAGCIGESDYHTGGKEGSPGRSGKSLDLVGPDKFIGHGFPTPTQRAAAQIAAIAAMLRLTHPYFLPDQVETLLKSCCVDMGPKGYDTKYGWGIPDLRKILAVSSISMQQSSIRIIKGESQTLSVSVKPDVAVSGQTVTWKSLNAAVATVDSKGVVTARQTGSATILATAGSKTARCLVIVETKDQTGWGWRKINENRYYYPQAGGKPVSGLQKIDGRYYYFDSAGCMKTGILKLNGSYYYFNKDGVRCSSFVYYNGGLYYFVPETGAMVTGWQTINGKKYYFQPSGNNMGRAAIGMTVIDGKNWFFNRSGSLRTGWTVTESGTYYLLENGGYATGIYWIWSGPKERSMPYYFDEQGHWQKGYYPEPQLTISVTNLKMGRYQTRLLRDLITTKNGIDIWAHSSDSSVAYVENAEGFDGPIIKTYRQGTCTIEVTCRGYIKYVKKQFTLTVEDESYSITTTNYERDLEKLATILSSRSFEYRERSAADDQSILSWMGTYLYDLKYNDPDPEFGMMFYRADTDTGRNFYKVVTDLPEPLLDGMHLMVSFPEAQNTLMRNGWQPFYRDGESRYYGKVVNNILFEVELNIDGGNVKDWSVRNGINPDYLGETSRAFWRRAGYIG